MLGTEGVKLAMSGDCANAVDKLARAEALVHAPTTALPLARCDIQLGKLVAGTEILNRLVHEPLAPNSPPSWIEAKKNADPLLEATEPRIAKLRIHLDGTPSLATAAVAIDGEAVPSVLLDNDRPTDPGTHHVTAEAPGFRPAALDVTVSDGQSQTVSLRLEAEPVAAATANPNPVVPPPEQAVASSAPSRVPAYVFLGIGAAGVVVGSVFGVLALGAKSSLDSECNSAKVCAPSAQGDINSLHTDSLVSTVGWGVGIVGLGLGTYFFVTSHQETPPKAALMVRPWLSPNGAGIAGSFQ